MLFNAESKASNKTSKYHMLQVQTKLMTELNQIQVKTLICQGTDDKFCSVEGTKHGHSLMPNSQLKLYEDAYHCLHDDLPETKSQSV